MRKINPFSNKFSILFNRVFSEKKSIIHSTKKSITKLEYCINGKSLVKILLLRLI